MKRLLLVWILIICFNGFLILATDEDIFVWGEFNVKVELGEDIQAVSYTHLMFLHCWCLSHFELCN